MHVLDGDLDDEQHGARLVSSHQADALDDFDAAYAKTDWSRFAHLPAFDVTNRRNAFNTYIRMQGGDK